jgi:iron complex outermembrane receptor protein
MKQIALCFLTSIIISQVFAQEKISELDPVTVTASINPEKASQTGRDLIVIKGERFTNLPVHSIDELLRYLPGIEMQFRGPMGSQSDIVIRGGTFQQVLVIVDGLRLNDPNSGHFASYFPIAPAEIDRIEILKGASSAVYGSEAVGGVVHIITKTFAAKNTAPLQKQRLNAIAKATGGEYDFLNLNVGGFFDNGTTSVAGGLLTNTTSGQAQRGTRGFVHNNTASLSFNHHIGEQWEVKIRTAHDSRKFAAQNFYTTFASDTADEKVTTSWSQLGVVRNGNMNRISLHVGYKDLDDQYKFNSASPANKSNSKLIQALLTDEWKVQAKTTITSGLQFMGKKISSNDRGKHNIDQAAAFAVLNQQLGNSFFVNPALRVEWNERSGWELIPQANISYRIPKLQLRASAGKTIRDADFTERFNNYNKTFVASGRIGNPDLVAEHSFSYEAGADFFATGNLKLSGTFFQRYHTDLIDYVTTPYANMPRKVNLSPAGTYALAKNISKVTTTGAEAEIQYSMKFQNRQQLWTSIGCTWLDSKSSSATPSFYISSHAKFLNTFSVLYSSNKFSASVNGLYKKRNPQTTSVNIAKVTSDYFVINAKLEAFVIKKLLSAFVEADNIFDKTFADLLGSQMPGRWLMGGIKISLSK